MPIDIERDTEFSFELTIIQSMFLYDQDFEIGNIVVCHSIHHDTLFDSEINWVKKELDLLSVYAIVNVGSMTTVDNYGTMHTVPGIMFDKIPRWFPISNFVKIKERIKKI